jgi:hypothetical protein
MSQKPMPLNKLPEYLKSLQEHENPQSSCVIDMGRIVDATQDVNWTQRIVFSLTVLLVFAFSSFTIYNFFDTEQMTVVMNLTKDSDPFETIPKIISDSGGKILSVKQQKDSSYEVKLSTRKSKSLLLQWLRKNSEVETAEIKSTDI